MSLLQTRGGIPRVFRATVTTTGVQHRCGRVGADSHPFTTSSVVARNKGASIVRMFFTEDDFDSDANYVELPVAAATAPHGEWAGPVEAENLWFKSVAGSIAIEVTYFQRRG